MKNNLLKKIFDVANKSEISAVLIGGLALPAYNVSRTTLDIDICISIKSQEQLDKYVSKLKEINISTQQKPKIHYDQFTVYGKNNEAEIWLKPCDAFNWDAEMEKRIKYFFENIYVLSIEDFILTKLARSDRSPIDLSDIFQILIANKDIIDWDYLRFRLAWIDLKEDFIEIIKGFELTSETDLKKISHAILKKFIDSS